MDSPAMVLGILCNWCAYAAADAAGASHFHYPATTRLMRVMCSGRVSPTLVLEAFASGADGVVIGACRPGDCHYLQGNCLAAFRVRLLHTLMDQLGIETDRLRLVWVSAADASAFAQTLRDQSRRLAHLGPVRGARGALMSGEPGSERIGGDP